NDRRVGRIQPRSQAPRVQLRRIDCDLRAHAGGRHGQRSLNRLFPISRCPPPRHQGACIVTESAAHVRIIEETPAYWRVLFDNPPLNIVGARIFEGLQDLIARMDASPSLRVVVFESANPEFYLAHFDLSDTSGSLGLIKTAGPSGLPILMDTFVR